jgi:hypothetical protein
MQKGKKTNLKKIHEDHDGRRAQYTKAPGTHS